MRSTLFAHQIGFAAENQALAIGRPAGVGFVPVFVQQRFRLPSIGIGKVDLPDLSMLPGHHGQPLSIRRPVRHKHFEIIRGELHLVASIVCASPPQAFVVIQSKPTHTPSREKSTRVASARKAGAG